jgi:hypothetical protein
VKVELRQAQWDVFTSDRRFRVLVAGRRFGKTHLALVELCRAAWGNDRVAWYVAPTYRQAKRVAWKRLKQLTKSYWKKWPSETELSIELISGGTIALRGADNYDSLRGEGLDFVVLDEFASMEPAAWTEVLRPPLSDRLGRALFIGTPKGFNHFYGVYERAREAKQEGLWATWQFTTEQGGWVAESELELAAAELDARTYEQEYRASFQNLTVGRVYYAFDDANLREQPYRRDLPFLWSVDFNINPMASVIAQKIPLHRPQEFDLHAILTGQRPEGARWEIQVLTEIVLPDSNTFALCEEFARRLESVPRPITIRVFGDASGAQRHSSASQSDWQVVSSFLHNLPGVQVTMCVGRTNPTIRQRVTEVNAALCNSLRQRRLFIDPKRCRELIKDLKQVVWAEDSSGNFLAQLSRKDPRRTHVSDALGYLVHAEMGLRPSAGEVAELLC